MEFLNKAGLQALISKIKEGLNGKVDKVSGKGLSTNDLTNDLKSSYDSAVSKVNGVASGAQVNKIETVKVNGTALTIANDKSVNVTVPTNNSSLTNGAGYQTAANVRSIVTGYGYQTSSQVTSAINSAVGKITSFDQKIVESYDKLPATGVKGTFYFIAHSHSDDNDAYDEYLWNPDSSKYEKIGNTDVNLDGYVKTTDLTALGAADVNTLWSA